MGIVVGWGVGEGTLRTKCSIQKWGFMTERDRERQTERQRQTDRQRLRQGGI